MNQPYGLYVTIEKDGRIKRNLVTKSGTETVDSVSVKDELINFSARDMGTYLYFMKKIEKCADAIQKQFTKITAKLTWIILIHF